MASLRKTRAGSYIACFRHGKRQYQRALRTKNDKAAEAALGRVVDRIYRLTTGDLSVPQGVDVGDFIVWGDAAQPNGNDNGNGQQTVPSFGELIEEYLGGSKGFKAESTLVTERIHLKNAESCLGAQVNRPVDRLHHKDLVQVLQRRLQKVADTTVKKERQTLVSLFSWAVQHDIIQSSPAAALPTIKADCDRPPFRTLEEVEELLFQGDLEDEEAAEIWECLYVTQAEIAEILALAKERANDDFIHPMFAIIAYTGMRRGEMLRLRWIDVDFRRKLITARSLKQSRQKRETSRDVDLHPELEAILAAYRQTRRKGRHVICTAGSADALTKGQANEAFRRALKGTRWQREMPSGGKKIVIGFHTFRHSFASNLAMQGVDQRIIDRWMGHQTEAMRRRYGRYDNGICRNRNCYVCQHTCWPYSRRSRDGKLIC